MRALRLGLGLAALVIACATPAAATPGVQVETLSTNTVDGVDYLVARITIAPGAATGWHYHPGDVFGYIREGTLTHWNAAGDGCVIDAVYEAGVPVKEGVGPGFIHNGRNQGPAPLVMEVAYVNPVGTPLSVEVPAPAACPVSDTAQ
jgi:mannose-6-phosphate isomerase-like protein (cupin superfamily)